MSFTFSVGTNTEGVKIEGIVSHYADYRKMYMT